MKQYFTLEFVPHKSALVLKGDDLKSDYTVFLLTGTFQQF